MDRAGLRRRIAQAKATKKKSGYAASLRQEVMTYANKRHGEGASFKRIAEEIAISFHTLMLWRLTSDNGCKLRKVKIVRGHRSEQGDSEGTQRQSSESTLTLRCTNGIYVEGLSVSQATQLIRSLS
jgi:hypothetical protein